jgi:hypothetical protein
MSTPDPVATTELRAILDAIREIRYGSVEIVIQDSRVVQIERREKTRFDFADHGGRKTR